MNTLESIARFLDGEARGNPATPIRGVNSLEQASHDEITFLVKKGFDPATLKAGALIVARGSMVEYPNLIYVDHPYMAFARLLDYFHPAIPFCEGIHPDARVAETATLGKNVTLGPFTTIGEDAGIGDNTQIHSGVIVYPGAKVGNACLIYSNVVIREGVSIGDHCIIHSGVVIGADGFGFSRDSEGIPRKIPQKGRVTIGSHCEIGANSCIDRSTIEETRLGNHVKLDNMVQVGHNTHIGDGSTISALTGISGSVRVGRNVIMGGQVGIADHVHIADGVVIAGKTGVTGHIKSRQIISGYPHSEIRKWRRSQVLLRNLDEYVERIATLEEKIKKLEEQ